MTMPYRDFNPHQFTGRFALLGDTQRTMLYQVLMGRERDNHHERSFLVQEIHQRQPDFLGILGDLVCYGEKQTD
jgi:hypothetical protein